MPTVSVQEIITAATYNGLQSRVETVLGTGFSDTGYGQVLASNVVSANSVITAEKMVYRGTIHISRIQESGDCGTQQWNSHTNVLSQKKHGRKLFAQNAIHAVIKNLFQKISCRRILKKNISIGVITLET